MANNVRYPLCSACLLANESKGEEEGREDPSGRGILTLEVICKGTAMVPVPNCALLAVRVNNSSSGYDKNICVHHTEPGVGKQTGQSCPSEHTYGGENILFLFLIHDYLLCKLKSHCCVFCGCLNRNSCLFPFCLPYWPAVTLDMITLEFTTEMQNVK